VEVAGVDVAFGISLVDPGNLVREKSIAAEIIIDLRRPRIWPRCAWIRCSASIFDAR
jgi:hypothetical protein